MRDKVASGGKMVLPIGRSQAIKKSFVGVGSLPLVQSSLASNADRHPGCERV